MICTQDSSDNELRIEKQYTHVLSQALRSAASPQE